MRADYLRVSVTDRCNLRCAYCSPLCGYDLLRREEVLTLEEIVRIVRLFARCGIRKVRLTGGEPLVRKNIVYLVEKLVGIEEIEEIALTTNGVLLGAFSADLKKAGLRRVNISAASAERQNYKEITGFDLLTKVTQGICKAIEAGLAPVKINSVIIKSINFSQIVPLARMSVDMPVAVRFIEYCPTSRYTRPAGDYVPTSRVYEIIENEFGPLAPVCADEGNGPASYFRIRNSAGTIGFISGRSTTFCQSCNRLRLTSDGKVLPCLYSSQCYDVKQLIRAGADDDEIMMLLESILCEKSNFTRSNAPLREFSMQSIGG